MFHILDSARLGIPLLDFGSIECLPEDLEGTMFLAGRAQMLRKILKLLKKGRISWRRLLIFDLGSSSSLNEAEIYVWGRR